MRCIVPGCDVDYRCTSTSKGVTLLRFPTDSAVRKTWLNSLQRNGWQLTEDSAVCSKHFQREDLLVCRDGQWSLRAGAIPVICLPNKTEGDKWMKPHDVKVCRICFATDCKLYSMIKHRNLDEAYEALTGLSTENNDNLPLYLCSECSRRLLNCIQFRTRTIQANLILQDIIQNNEYLTLEAITSCNGYRHLNSTLGVTHKCHYDLEIKHVDKENREDGHIHGTSNVYDVNIVKVEKDVATQGNLEDQDATNTPTHPLKLHEVIVPGIKLEKDDMYSQDNSEQAANFNDMGLHNSTMIKVKVEPIEISNQDYIQNDNHTHRDGHFGEDYPSDNVFFEEMQKHRTQSRLAIHTGKNSLIKIHSGKNNKQYSCDVCKKVFNKKYNLITHIRIHTGVRPFACDLCKQEFTLKHDLVNHMRKHSGEKPFACDICKKTFILRNVLQAHLRTHTGEKPFVCKICDKAFSQRANLSAHIKTHSGEKPYSCDICKKGFSQRCNLITHSRTHSGEKPYSCNVCMISFSRNYHLQGHLKKHSGEKPYICDLCKKAFTSQGNLQKHMTVHTGDKPYSCNLCNKAFNRKGNLNTHIKTHSNERPYQCEVCNKSFRRKDQLKIHSRIHSNEKPFGFVDIENIKQDSTENIKQDMLQSECSQ